MSESNSLQKFYNDVAVIVAMYERDKHHLKFSDDGQHLVCSCGRENETLPDVYERVLAAAEPFLRRKWELENGRGADGANK